LRKRFQLILKYGHGTQDAKEQKAQQETAAACQVKNQAIVRQEKRPQSKLGHRALNTITNGPYYQYDATQDDRIVIRRVPKNI
jgi:hypothetical protein